MSAVIGACWSGIVSVPHVGPLETTVERLGTCYYTVKQKREILGNAGLQHVADVHHVWRGLGGVVLPRHRCTLVTAAASSPTVPSQGDVRVSGAFETFAYSTGIGARQLKSATA